MVKQKHKCHMYSPQAPSLLSTLNVFLHMQHPHLHSRGALRHSRLREGSKVGEERGNAEQGQGLGGVEKVGVAVTLVCV